MHETFEFVESCCEPHWRLNSLLNSLIQDAIGYAYPVYSTAAQSSLRHLDVVYNSAFRFATGLPKWSPFSSCTRKQTKPLSVSDNST